MVAKQILKFKTLMKPSNLNDLRPNFRGKYFVHRSEQVGFELSTIQMHRMLLRGKAHTHFTTQVRLQKAIGPKLSYAENYRMAEELKLTPNFSIFFPEYIIELTTWVPKVSSLAYISESISTHQVIKLTDINGRVIMIRGEDQRATLDLWHYVYNKGVQTTLPNYLIEDKSQSRVTYRFSNEEAAREFELVQVRLDDRHAADWATYKWMFDLNVDQMDKLCFRRTSLVLLRENRIVLCMAARPDIRPDSLLTSQSVEQDLNQFLAKVDQTILFFKNLATRGVYLSKGFNLKQMAVGANEIFIENIEDLRVEVCPSSEEVVKSFQLLLNSLTKLVKVAIGKIQLNSKSQKNVDTLKQINESFQDGKIKTVNSLICRLRRELDLEKVLRKSRLGFSRKVVRSRGSGKTRTKASKLSSVSQAVSDVNTLDMELLRMRRKQRTMESLRESESSLPIDNEGEVEDQSRFIQRSRTLAFKNRFQV